MSAPQIQAVLNPLSIENVSVLFVSNDLKTPNIEFSDFRIIFQNLFSLSLESLAFRRGGAVLQVTTHCKEYCVLGDPKNMDWYVFIPSGLCVHYLVRL